LCSSFSFTKKKFFSFVDLFEQSLSQCDSSQMRHKRNDVFLIRFILYFTIFFLKNLKTFVFWKELLMTVKNFLISFFALSVNIISLLSFWYFVLLSFWYSNFWRSSKRNFLDFTMSNFFRDLILLIKSCILRIAISFIRIRRSKIFKISPSFLIEMTKVKFDFNFFQR
jgi:hypothetical protein